MSIRLYASILILSLACSGCAKKPDIDPDVATLVDVTDGKPIKDRCDQDRDVAFKNQIMAAAPFQGPTSVDLNALVLTVDRGQWHNLGFGVQQQVIAIIDCADAGPGKYHETIFVASPDRREIMKIPASVLMGWRAAGLASLDQTGLRPDQVATEAAIPNPSPSDPGSYLR